MKDDSFDDRRCNFLPSTRRLGAITTAAYAASLPQAVNVAKAGPELSRRPFVGHCSLPRAHGVAEKSGLGNLVFEIP